MAIPRRVVSHQFDFLPRLGRLRLPIRVEGAQQRLDLRVARRDLRLVKAISFQGLAQGKEMVLLPVAFEALPHFLFLLLEHLRCAQRGEHGGVALPGEDGLDDPQSAHPVELAQDVVEAHIHQIQGALHVQEVRGGHREVILAQPVEAAQLADRLLGDEARAQQPVTMQHGVPLAVAHVALAPRQIARVRAVEERDLEAGRLEQVVDGDPIDAGRFHRDGVDLVLGEPRAQGAQLAGEGAKGFDRRGGGGGENLRRAQIERGKAGQNGINHGCSVGWFEV